MSANILVICEILNRLGSSNPFSPTSPFEFQFSGPKTTETIALESCLRNLVHRYQELEQKVIEQRPETGVKGTVQPGRVMQNVVALFDPLKMTPPLEPGTAEANVFTVMPKNGTSISCSIDLYL